VISSDIGSAGVRGLDGGIDNAAAIGTGLRRLDNDVRLLDEPSEPTAVGAERTGNGIVSPDGPSGLTATGIERIGYGIVSLADVFTFKKRLVSHSGEYYENSYIFHMGAS